MMIDLRPRVGVPQQLLPVAWSLSKGHAGDPTSGRSVRIRGDPCHDAPGDARFLDAMSKRRIRAIS